MNELNTKLSAFQIGATRLKRISYLTRENSPGGEFQVAPIVSTSVAKDEAARTAVVTLSVLVFTKEENAPFSIEIDYEGMFRWTEEIDDKADRFLMVNAPATLYPLIRPLVLQFSSISGHEPLVLPMINFSQTTYTKSMVKENNK